MGQEFDDVISSGLIDAARAILVADGPEALTVRRISERAGVSTMAVYSRFGGKDGVIERLYLEGFEQLRRELLGVPTTVDPIADIRNWGLTYRQFALANPSLFAIMFDRAADFEMSPASKAVLHDTLELFAQRINDRLNRDGRSIDARAVAAMLWSSVHGIVTLELKGIGPALIDWQHVIAVSTATYRAALRQ